jgi:hypothetical protein
VEEGTAGTLQSIWMKTVWEGGRRHRRHAAEYREDEPLGKVEESTAGMLQSIWMKTAWEGGRRHRRQAAEYLDKNRLERWKKALQARCRVSGWKPLGKVEESAWYLQICDSRMSPRICGFAICGLPIKLALPTSKRYWTAPIKLIPWKWYI